MPMIFVSNSAPYAERTYYAAMEQRLSFTKASQLYRHVLLPGGSSASSRNPHWPEDHRTVQLRGYKSGAPDLTKAAEGVCRRLRVMYGKPQYAGEANGIAHCRLPSGICSNLSCIIKSQCPQSGLIGEKPDSCIVLGFLRRRACPCGYMLKPVQQQCSFCPGSPIRRTTTFPSSMMIRSCGIFAPYIWPSLSGLDAVESVTVQIECQFSLIIPFARINYGGGTLAGRDSRQVTTRW